MPKLTLPLLMDSFTIAGATDSTWEAIIAAGYNDLDKIRGLTLSQIADVRRSSGIQIGETNGTKIYNSLTSPRVQALLARAEVWLDTTPPPAAAPIKIDLTGKNVVLTGTGPAPRPELEARLKAAGANVQSSVSATTHVLICESADSTSSKAKKARQVGTTVMGYAEVF